MMVVQIVRSPCPAHNAQLVWNTFCKTTGRVLITTRGGPKGMVVGTWLILLFGRT